MRFINATPGVSVLELTRPLMQLAARTRALTKLRTPDALVVSAAMLHRCPVLVGNNRKMKAINSLRTATFGGGTLRAARFPRFVYLNDCVD
jgi:hypothetical protein